MIVVVETNFLLELALQQSEAEQAEALLRMAEDGEIRLAIPAIAFAEAYSKLHAQAKWRNGLCQDLRTEVRQIARSRPYFHLEKISMRVSEALHSSEAVRSQELARITERVRACATVISLTGDVTRDMSMLKTILKLQCGDAFICACVHRFFTQECSEDEQGLFVTKETDFKKTEQFLATVGCELVLGFGAAIGAMKVRDTVT